MGSARLWWQKWRWYERNSLPWNRARIHWEFARREAFVRWPVHGNVLEALREGRLEIGANTLLEPGVWITAPDAARVRIGARIQALAPSPTVRMPSQSIRTRPQARTLGMVRPAAMMTTSANGTLM